MAKRLYTNPVVHLRTCLTHVLAQKDILAQSKDLCDLESRMKRMYPTQGRFGL